MTLAGKEDCTGCSACAAVCPVDCIAMEADGEGFLFPRIDEAACIACGACERVCPVLHKREEAKAQKAFAVWAKDGKIRAESSSGGVFSLLAAEILARKGAVFGACYDENLQVLHRCAETSEDLAALRGSKYVQSAMGDTFWQVKSLLGQDRPVLFSGTPCQIGGLRAFLGEKPSKGLLCVAVACHGVPSPAVWARYLAHTEKAEGSPVVQIAQRGKNSGWKRYSVVQILANGESRVVDFRKDWMMRAFLRDACLRKSCHNCRFKEPFGGDDVLLADFWGVERILPEMDDDKGTSLVVCRTEAGAEAFAAIAGQTRFAETDFAAAAAENSAILRSVAENPNRKAFFAGLDTMPFDDLVNRYCKNPSPLVNLPKRALRKLRRLFTKE